MSVILYALMLSSMITIFSPGTSDNVKSGNSELKVGSKVPEFILPDQEGKMFDLRKILGKENLVIYFYVKDETPGCTKEACTFRDNYTQFQKDNAVVIGISAQSVKSHREFADKYNLPFTLLSDSNNKVRRLFGVKNVMGSIPGRETFVIDKQGKVVYIFNSNTKPVEHVTEALRILDGRN
jgi:peroxiredoxin Q/BCP